MSRYHPCFRQFCYSFTSVFSWVFRQKWNCWWWKVRAYSPSCLGSSFWKCKIVIALSPDYLVPFKLSPLIITGVSCVLDVWYSVCVGGGGEALFSTSDNARRATAFLGASTMCPVLNKVTHLIFRVAPRRVPRPHRCSWRDGTSTFWPPFPIHGIQSHRWLGPHEKDIVVILFRLTEAEHLCEQLKGRNGYFGVRLQLMVAWSYAMDRTSRWQGNMPEKVLYVMATHEWGGG